MSTASIAEIVRSLHQAHPDVNPDYRDARHALGQLYGVQAVPGLPSFVVVRSADPLKIRQLGLPCVQEEGIWVGAGPLLALTVPRGRYEFLLRARMGLWTKKQRALILSGRSPHSVAPEIGIPKSYIYHSDLWREHGRRARGR